MEAGSEITKRKAGRRSFEVLNLLKRVGEDAAMARGTDVTVDLVPGTRLVFVLVHIDGGGWDAGARHRIEWVFCTRGQRLSGEGYVDVSVGVRACIGGSMAVDALNGYSTTQLTSKPRA